MELWHRHNWQEVTRTYAPPVAWNGEISGGAALIEFLTRCKFGVTTVLWQCEGCQSFRQDELLGRETRSKATERETAPTGGETKGAQP